MYGPLTERRLAAVEPADGLVEALKIDRNESVGEIAEWASAQLQT